MRELTDKRLSRRNSRFYKIYFAVLWVVLIAAVAGWFYLNNTLSEYESRQPGKYAAVIAKEVQNGDVESLCMALTDFDGLTDDADALLAFAKENPNAGYDVVQTSASSTRYSYRLTAGGVAIGTFTLVDETGDSNWAVFEAAVDESILYWYADHLATVQTDIVLSLMSGSDYSALYSMIPSIGLAEDTLEAFTAFMQETTPSGGLSAVLLRESEEGRKYDILANGGLFATLTMAQDGKYGWRIDSFDLSESIRSAYAIRLADNRATEILNLFINGSAAPIHACCVASGYPGEAEAQFAEHLARLSEGVTFTCSIYPESNAETRSYRIDGGETKFADFTLIRTRDASGMDCWAVSAFDMPVWQPYEAMVTAAVSSTVYMNGVALTAADIIETYVPEGTDERVLANYPDRVTMAVYRVRTAFDQPQLYAIDWDGKLQTLTEPESRAFLFPAYRADAEFDQAMYDWLAGFCETLGWLTMADKHMNSMRQYLEWGSPAWVFLANYDNHWIKVHYKDKNRFFDFEATDFVRYSDTMFSVDVKFALSVTYRQGQTEETYRPEYRLFLEWQDDQWRIYAFSSIAE